MLCAAAVVMCALDLLYRPVSSFPPIVLIDTRPPDVTATAEAFVRRNPDTIYLITSTPTFRAAHAGHRDALQKVASILVHEDWHIRNGPDERRAYETQLMTLLSLGVGEGRPVFAEVRRSMRLALAAQKRAAPRPEGVVAAAR